ncbi:thymidine kinase, partial [Candidatus Dependentiae bacterium]|nr:thymidine kinase [Candidatus Dependentiae bacterium]
MDRKNQGSLEIICGSMFSGKSEELIRRLRRAEIANKKVISFKPCLDIRHSLDHVSSHNGNSFKAVAIDNPSELLTGLDPAIEIIGIDEVQFFPMSVVSIILQLVRGGKRVIAAGLDLDFFYPYSF